MNLYSEKCQVYRTEKRQSSNYSNEKSNNEEKFWNSEVENTKEQIK